MAELRAFFNFIVGLVIENGKHKRGLAFCHEIHLDNSLAFFEYILLLLHAEWLQNFSDPREESLISLIFEECDLRDHLLINHNGKLNPQFVWQLIHELGQVLRLF